MPKKITCPSCEAEVFAGKYCLECGAELETPEKAVFSEDAIENLADRVANKILERQKAEQTTKEGDDNATKKEGAGTGAGADTGADAGADAGKRRFFRT